MVFLLVCSPVQEAGVGVGSRRRPVCVCWVRAVLSQNGRLLSVLLECACLLPLSGSRTCLRGTRYHSHPSGHFWRRLGV